MNVYNPRTPRAAFGVAAAAMAGITMALMVVLPAELEDAGAAEYTLATAPAPANTAAVHRGLDLDVAIACEERGLIVRVADEMQLACVDIERPVSTASLRDRL